MQQHNKGDKSNNSPKDNTHYNQQQTFFEYLQKTVATASMVADATGIYQKNICRFKIYKSPHAFFSL